MCIRVSLMMFKEIWGEKQKPFKEKKNKKDIFFRFKIFVAESNFNFKIVLFFFNFTHLFPFHRKKKNKQKKNNNNRIMLTSVVMFCAITKFFIFFQNKLWQG